MPYCNSKMLLASAIVTRGLIITPDRRIVQVDVGHGRRG